ncbi:hypothetical protein DRJ17_04895 [Candidatus Woesearchaeota archaeon]|nr:MAG: hypothetical protein DRJ17_04895 [Candidatus Woesearchaeota archaeon]
MKRLSRFISIAALSIGTILLSYATTGCGGSGGGGVPEGGNQQGTYTPVAITHSRIEAQSGSNDSTNIYTGDTVSYYASCLYGDLNKRTSYVEYWLRNNEEIADSANPTFTIPTQSYIERPTNLAVRVCCTDTITDACLTSNNKQVHPGQFDAKNFTNSYLQEKGIPTIEIDYAFECSGYNFTVPATSSYMLCTNYSDYEKDVCIMFGKHGDDIVEGSYLLDNSDPALNGEEHSFSVIEQKSRKLWDPTYADYIGMVAPKLCFISLRNTETLEKLFTYVDACLTR